MLGRAAELSHSRPALREDRPPGCGAPPERGRYCSGSAGPPPQYPIPEGRARNPGNPASSKSPGNGAPPADWAPAPRPYRRRVERAPTGPASDRSKPSTCGSACEKATRRLARTGSPAPQPVRTAAGPHGCDLRQSRYAGSRSRAGKRRTLPGCEWARPRPHGVAPRAA